ncbi:MAG TPA: class F sortase [Sporichthyaceae bacterium]|nr:class F sortase [Sporichthyaceae bacterium]
MGQHVRRTGGMRSRLRAIALVGGSVLGLCLAVAVPVARADDPPPAPSGSIGPVPIPPIPIPPIFSPPEPQQPQPGCSNARQPFVPNEVDIPGVAEGIAVLAMRRDGNGHPGVPPLTRAGKAEMAFDLDSGIRPGDRAGNSLFNAHTWPDGSALGNRFLAELHEGARIVVHGKTGRMCYKVTDRVEVPANETKRYYASEGRPQLALAVCSGRRLGPGVWTRRTLWFASPIR